jgi:hypothetical protein
VHVPGQAAHACTTRSRTAHTNGSRTSDAGRGPRRHCPTVLRGAGAGTHCGCMTAGRDPGSSINGGMAPAVCYVHRCSLQGCRSPAPAHTAVQVGGGLGGLWAQMGSVAAARGTVCMLQHTPRHDGPMVISFASFLFISSVKLAFSFYLLTGDLQCSIAAMECPDQASGEPHGARHLPACHAL